MKFSDFYVVTVNRNTNNISNIFRTVIYTDDINKYIEFEYKNDKVTIEKEENYILNDYLWIIDRLFENTNIKNNIFDIIDTLKELNSSEEFILAFVKVYCHKLFKKYNY